MQVVGYHRTGHEDGPALLLADDGVVETVPLEPGTDLAYTLGERHCAGTIEGGEGSNGSRSSSDERGESDGGVHEPCDAPTAPYCDYHTHRWPCARCTGDCDKPIDNCDREHAVYLAAFAPDHHKVGVTKTPRLETRLHEQGADRGVHLATVDDGRIARKREAVIAQKIPDRVRVPTKIAGLHRSVDEDAWRALLAEYDPIGTIDLSYDVDLDSAPVPEVTATGTVHGVKGRVLVLEDRGTHYAVDLRDLHGYEVEAGASSRERQASFGAFR